MFNLVFQNDIILFAGSEDQDPTVGHSTEPKEDELGDTVPEVNVEAVSQPVLELEEHMFQFKRMK